MQWEDEAIVLAARRHGEGALVVQLLTAAHGRHAGLVRGGQAPKLRMVYQIGNRLQVVWKARLAEHLGNLTGELLHGHAARLMDDPPRLACLAAIAAMAEAALPEREPHPRVFAATAALLVALDSDRGWAAGYVEWELALLAELGFGLDLSRCAATGERAALVYVSPKSGQAVSAAAGEPYRDRLLPLPAFLLPDGGAASLDDVLQGLRLTDHFFEHRVFAPANHRMPPARARFVDVLRRIATVPHGPAS